MEKLSNLYRRYHGFMLGLVFGAILYLRDEKRYTVHLRRMREFIAEAGINIPIPETWAEFMDVKETLVTDLGGALQNVDDRIYLHWFLGLEACGLASKLDAKPDIINFISNQFEEIARICGVSRTAYLRYQKRLNNADKKMTWSGILNPAYTLLESLIAAADPEEDTCFVAMPFSSDFPERYKHFYRPALEKHGFRALRGWDGFGTEEYLALLQTIIKKCGAFLGEISEDPDVGCSNSNVIHEVGISHGLAKLTFLVAEESSKPPSNLSQLTACNYKRDDQNWPISAIKNFDFYKAMLDASYQFKRDEEKEIESEAKKSPYQPKE